MCNFDELILDAYNIRRTCLEMAYKCGCNTHLGGGLSIIDPLVVLYGRIMNCAEKGLPYSQKDKFVLSKGHGVLGYYATLAEYGIIEKAVLDSFMQDGSDLIAHPVMKPEFGIEASTGSLGQGISIAVGLALSAKRNGYLYRTYVICGNGEFNEGSVWEACMAAVNYKLDNLTVYIDNNHMQSDGFSESIMNVSDKYTAMLDSLGFRVEDVDGHDLKKLYDSFNKKPISEVPTAIVGNSIKGKGVSFMENDPRWHHNRLTEESFELAIHELEESFDRNQEK